MEERRGDRPVGSTRCFVPSIAPRECPRPRTEHARSGVGRRVRGPCLLITARTGTRSSWRTAAAPIRDPQSAVIGAVIVFRDVTERERMEEQLATPRKLEASESAGGSHTIQQPPTGVFGFVDVARTRASKTGDPSEVCEPAREVADRSRQGAGTDAAATHLCPRRCEPIRRSYSWASWCARRRFTLSGSNVVADIQIAEHLWPCEWTSNSSNQVVDNLLLNAGRPCRRAGSCRSGGCATCISAAARG